MLKLLGVIYGKAANLRNRLYERGILKSHRLPVPVISIGNITAGGTGKTPLVALAAGILSDLGEKVCVVSRGYGRANERELVVVSDGEKILADVRVSGDEPLELAKELLGKASVVCDADRVRAGSYATGELGATAIVLDDAFQHRRIERDLDIVVIDATRPDGGGRMLPAGRLREPFSNLARADLIVLTRSDQAEDLNSVTRLVRESNPHIPVINCTSNAEGLIPLRSEASPQLKEGECFFLFCGIGNPAALVSQLEKEGIDLAGHRAFRDHHKYTPSDLRMIEEEAKGLGVNALLTTAKDAVKLEDLQTDLPCYIVKSRLILDDEPAFREALAARFK